MKTHGVSITYKTIIFTLLTIIGFIFFFLIRDILLAVFIAFLVMTALNPSVTWLEKKKIPRKIAIFVVYALVITVFVFIGFLVIPPLGSQLAYFTKTFTVPELPAFLKNMQFSVSDLSSLASYVGSSVGSVWQVVTSTFSGMFFVFTLLVMSFYLLIERKTLHKKVVWMFELKDAERVLKQFLDGIEVQLGGWIRGQVALMIIIGVITYVGLMLLGIPFALPLAVIAGLLEIFPNVGPTLSAIPAFFIAWFMVNPGMAMAVIVFYTILQQIENNVMVPKIMKSAADVEPLASIVLILIGFKLGNVVGALLAIPLYIVLRFALRMYMKETRKKGS